MPTDVEKTHAIEELIDKVDDHTGQAWADDILAGPLGTKGPDVVRNIEEAIAASKNLSEAREKRAEAYGPTYDAFLRFKRVVRSALGPSSKQYRRIHGRAAARDTEDNGGGGGSGAGPTGGGPTGGGGDGGADELSAGSDPLAPPSASAVGGARQIGGSEGAFSDASSSAGVSSSATWPRVAALRADRHGSTGRPTPLASGGRSLRKRGPRPHRLGRATYRRSGRASRLPWARRSERIRARGMNGRSFQLARDGCTLVAHLGG